MNNARSRNSAHARPAHPILGTSIALLLATAPFVTAQTTAITKPVQAIAEHANLELPDSPGALLGSSSSTADPARSVTGSDSAAPAQAATTTGSQPRHSAHLEMTVQPGEIAGPMTAHQKVVAGFKDSVSLFSASGWLVSAGWEQLTNGSPNYGTDAGAFGQRLGAAAIRGTSENIFSESLFAPLFHEDVRYYIMGPGHNFFKRAIYAGTRVIITRTDSGHATPNFAFIAGNAAGAALTIPYYPSQNTSFKEVASTFGGSLGGSALGFVVDEFIVDALVELHIKKKQP